MSGVTVRRVSEKTAGRLAARVLSTAVLVPPVLAAAHFGSPWFEGLVVLAALVLAWEWAGLTGAGAVRAAAVGAVLLSALVGAALSGPLLSLIVLALASTLMLTVARVTGSGEMTPKTGRPWAWSAAGVLYIGLPCVALIWLRADPAFGRQTIFWLFALVWAADIGAYAFGRLIGGPRLAPTVSPNKTWAGLIGGVACAGAAGAVTAATLEKGAIAPLVLLSALLGVVEQGGDLAESWVKRRSGAKDASNLIPGHGGLFDRVDGLLAAAGTVAVIGYLSEGGILTWP